MDPGTGSQQRLTSGQDTRSARCGESRTAGAGGGSRETTGGDIGTAPADEITLSGTAPSGSTQAKSAASPL